jgi:hypothetical protein
MLSPTTHGAPTAAIHSLSAAGAISFGLRCFASKLASTAGRIEFTMWRINRHGVTAWSFSSRCSPPGGLAPMQFRSDTGPPVSARSGTLTLLSTSALRRTSTGVAPESGASEGRTPRVPDPSLRAASRPHGMQPGRLCYVGRPFQCIKNASEPLDPRKPFWSAPAERSGGGALGETDQRQSGVAASLCHRTPRSHRQLVDAPMSDPHQMQLLTPVSGSA